MMNETQQIDEGLQGGEINNNLYKIVNSLIIRFDFDNLPRASIIFDYKHWLYLLLSKKDLLDTNIVYLLIEYFGYVNGEGTVRDKKVFAAVREELVNDIRAKLTDEIAEGIGRYAFEADRQATGLESGKVGVV